MITYEEFMELCKYEAMAFLIGGYTVTLNGATAEEAEQKVRDSLRGRENQIVRIKVYLTEERERIQRERIQRERQQATGAQILGHFGQSEYIQVSGGWDLH